MKRIVRVICVALILCLAASGLTFASQKSKKSGITYRGIKVVINNQEITPCDANGNPTEPFIVDSEGTTYLPVRAVAGALGLDVGWEDATSTVVLKSGGTVKHGKGNAKRSSHSKKAELHYRDLKITLDGKQVALKNEAGVVIEPFIMDDSTYLPVRAVGTALGCEIGWNDATSTVSLTEKNAGFKIYSQPQSVTVDYGDSATFTVVATGGIEPYSYQWYSAKQNSSSWSKMSGEKSYRLKITDEDQDMQYRCTIKDNAGKEVTSDAAKLTFKATKLTITKQPAAVKITSGSKATFSVTVKGGTTPYYYQWYQSDTDSTASKYWTKMSGETDSDLILKNCKTTKYYRCVITDKKDATVTTNIAKLTITDTNTMKFTTQPSSTSVAYNGSATLKVAVSGGTSPYSYQWYYCSTDSSKSSSWSKISKATSASYTVSDFKEAMYFRCIVTDKNDNEITSNSARITIKDENALSFTTQPAGKSVTVGDDVTLTVAVKGGTNSYTYDWQVSSDDKTWRYVDGASSSSYTFTTDRVGDKYYRCVALDTNGAKGISNSAKVTVKAIPTLSVTVDNASLTVEKGGSASFTVTASGGKGTYSYQWSCGADLEGETARKLTISDASETATYTCCVTDEAGNTAFVSARLVVNQPEPIDPPAPTPGEGGAGEAGEAGGDTPSV